jgi:hypothetical protein
LRFTLLLNHSSLQKKLFLSPFFSPLFLFRLSTVFFVASRRKKRSKTEKKRKKSQPRSMATSTTTAQQLAVALIELDVAQKKVQALREQLARETPTPTLPALPIVRATPPPSRHIHTHSNRQLITQAIEHVCLSGAQATEARQGALAELRLSPGEYFVVLFRPGDARKFRGLYLCNLKSQCAMRIYGKGLKIIEASSIHTYLGYSSTHKAFSPLPVKSLTPSVAGIILGTVAIGSISVPLS